MSIAVVWQTLPIILTLPLKPTLCICCTTNVCLCPWQNFPDQPLTYQEWGFTSPSAFRKAKETGQIEPLQQKLDILKGMYEKALKLDMPRGKRILMYHKAMIGWREFVTMVQNCNQNNKFLLQNYKIKRKAGYTLDDLEIFMTTLKLCKKY